MFQRLSKQNTSSSPVSIEGFSEREAVALFQAGKIRKINDGECIVRKGETSNTLILVLEGSCMILFGTDDNKSNAVNGEKGSLFGDPDLTKNINNNFSVVSCGSARILEIDRFAFNLLSPDIQTSV
jgi:CRP-like cAMP-binding protein